MSKLFHTLLTITFIIVALSAIATSAPKIENYPTVITKSSKFATTLQYEPNEKHNAISKRSIPYYGYGTYNRIVDHGYHYGGYNSGADDRQEVSPSLFTRIANFISEGWRRIKSGYNQIDRQGIESVASQPAIASAAGIGLVGLAVRNQLAYVMDTIFPPEMVPMEVKEILLMKIDGVFTEWGAWASCSVTCGDGVRARTRTCTNPEPANGGSDCSGASSESESCSTGTVCWGEDSVCTSASPCAAGYGDCDGNGECAGSLTCIFNDPNTACTQPTQCTDVLCASGRDCCG